MNQKDAYEQKLRAQLDQRLAEIVRLKAKAKIADADAGIERNQEIENVQVKFAVTSGVARKDLQKGLGRAWSSLSAATAAAKSRFK